MKDKWGSGRTARRLLRGSRKVTDEELLKIPNQLDTSKGEILSIKPKEK